jgi:transposase
LRPLFAAHCSFVLASRVVHADETPIGMLEPGGSKSKKACTWACARRASEAKPGGVDDFCPGRGGK